MVLDKELLRKNQIRLKPVFPKCIHLSQKKNSRA